MQQLLSADELHAGSINRNCIDHGSCLFEAEVEQTTLLSSNISY